VARRCGCARPRRARSPPRGLGGVLTRVDTVSHLISVSHLACNYLLATSCGRMPAGALSRRPRPSLSHIFLISFSLWPAPPWGPVIYPCLTIPCPCRAGGPVACRGRGGVGGDVISKHRVGCVRLQGLVPPRGNYGEQPGPKRIGWERWEGLACLAAVKQIVRKFSTS
jgi:hypothetical protein